MTAQVIYDSAKQIPKRATAGAAIGLFELFLLIFPELITIEVQALIYKAIGILGATGLADWIWRNRKNAFDFIKKLLTKKKDDTPTPGK
jgi:hypothetical protein